MKNNIRFRAILVLVLGLVPFSANAATFYTNEAEFNTATIGISLSVEGFETPFVSASLVDFTSFSIIANNVSDLESRASEEGGGHPSTEGLRLLQYSTLTPSAGGGGVTFSFGTPVNAFSIDIIDPLDGAAIDAFLSLSNSTGDSQIFLTGGQPNNGVFFIGIIDTTQTFNSVTIFSTKPQDAISLDRVQFNAVPIPSAFWLFGSGLVGLIGFMRRSSKK